jgi:hypothetical protein
MIQKMLQDDRMLVNLMPRDNQTTPIENISKGLAIGEAALIFVEP